MTEQDRYETKQFLQLSRQIKHDVTLLLANKNALKKDMTFRQRKFIEKTTQELEVYEKCIKKIEYENQRLDGIGVNIPCQIINGIEKSSRQQDKAPHPKTMKCILFNFFFPMIHNRL